MGMGNANHIKEATRQNTMSLSKANAGFDNAPNGKLLGKPAGNNLVSNTLSILNDDERPVCTNPPNTTNTITFLDSAASYSLMGCGAQVKILETQETNKILGTPNKAAIITTETLELLLKKPPKAARKAFRVPEIPHNLITAYELVDTGCGVHLYKNSAEIEFEGETLYQGWRDKPSRLWRFSLTY